VLSVFSRCWVASVCRHCLSVLGQWTCTTVAA